MANTTKFVGLSDGVNGFELQQAGATVQFAILSGTANGNQTVAKASWNLDKLDGTGPSGLTLDLTKTQIFAVDYQALYVGRVRMGFDIGGVIVYAHEFRHANLVAAPYIQYASLPVRCGMTCTGTVSTTMRFICAAVMSENSQAGAGGIPHTMLSSLALSAGNGVDTHALSIRPKLLFNGLANRTKYVLDDFHLSVSGNSPVLWKLVIGQALSGTTSFNDVNATYSSVEYNTAGTASGSPAMVLSQGVVAASAQSKGDTAHQLNARIPITLDVAGAHRANGTLTLLVQGLGGISACVAGLNWTELR